MSTEMIVTLLTLFGVTTDKHLNDQNTTNPFGLQQMGFKLCKHRKPFCSNHRWAFKWPKCGYDKWYNIPVQKFVAVAPDWTSTHL